MFCVPLSASLGYAAEAWLKPSHGCSFCTSCVSCSACAGLAALAPIFAAATKITKAVLVDIKAGKTGFGALAKVSGWIC